MAELSERDLLAQIQIEEGQALGYLAGDLSREREKALDYYNGLVPDVKAVEGRSDVVSTDVRDSVDGMLPDLLDVFLSSDDVVKFEPQGPEDEQGARQATDACNYVFYRQNNGALVLYEWMKSALMEKNGVVKYYHEKYSTPTVERYDGLNDFEFQQLIAQEGAEVLAHSAAPDPQMQGLSLHDVQVRIVDKRGKICVTGVPSEEFLICSDHNSLSMRDVRFVEHRQPLTVSQIRAMGIDVDPEEAEEVPSTQFAPEYTARRRFNEELQYGQRPSTDPASKTLTYCEISMLADVDGDGLAERRRIIKIGRSIYENDYADHVPFAAICPNIMPYRFYGLSIADLTSDIQKLKSVIWRQMLDSLYLANNPRIGVMESMVNLDDLLVSRPGGVVRFKTNPSMAWAPLEQRFVGQQAFPMVEYMDSVKENRTGFTRYSQGMDASSLNKTATGISLITTSAAKRQKLIARMFAETGVKDLMQGIKHLLIKTRAGKPIAMRLRGQWVNVDPREWKTGWDMTVNVGLGTNDKPAQAAHLQQIMGVQKELVMAGKTHLVTDINLYNSAKRLQETAGYKQEGEFFTPPGENNPPPQPPADPALVKAQIDAQIEQASIASAERIKQMEVMNGQAVAEIQRQTSIAVAQINAAAELQKEEMRLKAQASLEVFRAGNDAKQQHHQMAHDGALQLAKEATAAAAKPAGEDPKAKAAAETDKRALAAIADGLKMLAGPREVIRKNGEITGTRPSKA